MCEPLFDTLDWFLVFFGTLDASSLIVRCADTLVLEYVLAGEMLFVDLREIQGLYF